MNTNVTTFRTLGEAQRYREQMQSLYPNEYTIYDPIEFSYQTSLGEKIRYFEVTVRKWTLEQSV